MRKIVGCLILFALLLLSCNQEKRDLPESLKAIIKNTQNCTCDPYIDKYLWHNETIYLSSCGRPACDCSTAYYDGSGAKYNMDSGYLPDQFRQDAQLVKHVWRCKN